MKKIGVLGLWHLGCVYSACLADQGFNVVGYDPDKNVIENLKRNTPPLFEPGLEELIKKNNGNNLSFTSSPKDAIYGKDYIFLALDIPVKSNDKISLKQFDRLLIETKKHISPRTILVILSQVPVGTCRKIQEKFKNNKVLCLPENLRLGQAIEIFKKPDRIVLGGSRQARSKFIHEFNFWEAPFLEMSLESAEMGKHALNSYLALNISFASEVGDICEKVGADLSDVVKALKTDRRVSPNSPLSPGIGFAGGTLGRDLQTLKTIAKNVNYNPKLVKAIYKVNQDRLPTLTAKIKNTLGGVRSKKIGILGLTYKPGTNTLRRSQSLELKKMLEKLGAQVSATDPTIHKQDYKEFFKDLHAAILMTPWEEFKSIKAANIGPLMKQKIIFDARNFLDEKAFKKAGFKYFGIGR